MMQAVQGIKFAAWGGAEARSDLPTSRPPQPAVGGQHSSPRMHNASGLAHQPLGAEGG